MKLYLNRTFLTLIAAALLPTCAYAGTDIISASFERGLPCNLYTTTVVIADVVKESDPMEAEINAAIKGTDDPVLASYYRDLYRAPNPQRIMQFVSMPDPYLDAVNAALYGSTDPNSRMAC